MSSRPGVRSEKDILEAKRIKKLARNPSERSKQIGSSFEKLAPLLVVVLRLISVIAPFIEVMVKGFVLVKSVLTVELLLCLFGLVLCFFGGTFAVSIAAFEAFMLVGYKDTMKSLSYLYYEAMKVKEANHKDDLIDDDDDGIADVKQISSDKLIIRKTRLFFGNVQDPEAVTAAWGGIANGFLAVLATLKIDFAKVITLGASVGNLIKRPLSYVMAPSLGYVLGKKYKKWTPVIINATAMCIAITVAWTVQKILSAVHSAIKGGLMISRNFFSYLNKKEIMSIRHEETYLDEIVGWGIALLGIWFQLSNTFSLSFPWTIVLLPIRIFEGIMMWLVS